MKLGRAAQRDPGLWRSKSFEERQEGFCQSARPGTLCAYLFIHSFTQAELLRPAMCQVGGWAPGGHRGEQAKVTAEPTVGRRSKFE